MGKKLNVSRRTPNAQVFTIATTISTTNTKMPFNLDAIPFVIGAVVVCLFIAIAVLEWIEIKDRWTGVVHKPQPVAESDEEERKQAWGPVDEEAPLDGSSSDEEDVIPKPPILQRLLNLFQKNRVIPDGPIGESVERHDVFNDGYPCCIWFLPLSISAIIVVIVLLGTGVIN